MSTEVVICHVPFEDENVREILKQMKEDGVTSVQIYMHWNKFEGKGRGEFDFSWYDNQVMLLKEAGLKFFPFFLMGPRYAAPQWWLDDPNFVPLKCIEHGKECPIDSIWNPYFKAEIDRVLKAFAEHYLPMDVLEAVMPGICGDFGEAIMPVLGNWPNAYHTHKGMWCAGEDAKHSYREYMRNKYYDIDSLNEAWQSFYKSFDEMDVFQKHKAPSRTAWFDLVEWYRYSMTEYLEFWMQTMKKYFPNTPLYMCTGGAEAAEHASLFSEQAKVVAKYGGGIRLTNEASDFFVNFFSCNAYMNSACKLYGAKLGLEPAGRVTKEGIGTRILSSAFYGNNQIFFYFGNIYEKRDMNCERAQIFRKYISLVKERKREYEVAVLWPKYVGIMENGIPERLRSISKFIRQRTDYHFANENMIADGALEKIALLIIPTNIFTDIETVTKICEWVEKGGVLFNIGGVTDLELEPIEQFDRMIGFTEDTDYCSGWATYTIPEDIPFKKFAARKKYSTDVSCSNLADDVLPLAENPGRVYNEYIGIETKPTYSAFYRNYGKGKVITHLGPVDMENNTCGLSELVDDVLKNYAKDLRIKDDEVVRGEIDGEIYALTLDGDIKHR